MRRRREDRAEQYETPEYRALLGRLADNLRRVRAAQLLSQEEAAARCSMSTRLFQRLECEETNWTATTLARLCTGLETDPAELFRAPPARKPRPRAG